MRQWISIRGPGGLRFGQSIGPDDFAPPKLPNWRRYELRKQLQAAATAHGKDHDSRRLRLRHHRTGLLTGRRNIWARGFGLCRV